MVQQQLPTGFRDELGIHYYKSEANFIFFEAPDADADGLADAWLKEGY